MKTLITSSILALVTTLSFNVMADSNVEKSIVLNNAINKGNATVALGYDNIASTGSINIKDSKVSKSIVLNNSLNAGNATVALGEGNTAATGSITLE